MGNANGRQPMFTTMQFGSVEDAQKEVKKARIKELLGRIGLILGIISTVSFFLIFVFSPNQTMIHLFNVIWFITMIAGYVLGGGLLALSMAWKVARFGWFLVPVFPADIFIFLFTFICAILLFMFVPIVFILISYIQVRKDKQAAEDYLASFGVQPD